VTGDDGYAGMRERLGRGDNREPPVRPEGGGARR
jgi:hypothetical protein